MMTTACQANSDINMDGLQISLFGKEDIPALVEIENESFSTPFKEKDFSDMLESDISDVIVIKLGDTVVGYVSFTVIIDECQIINFATKSEYRRQRIGKKIMDALLEHCKKHGVAKVFLEVRESNIPAISLYEKYGFFKVGVSKGHFSKPREDAVLMNLEL